MTMRVRILVVAMVLSVLASCGSKPQTGPGAATPPPVPVSIAQAAEEMVPIQVRPVGNVEPYSTVGEKAQVGGQLLSVKFSDGSIVNAGDLLFEIDPRPFREALRQAESDIPKDQAELRVAEANIARAQVRTFSGQRAINTFEVMIKNSEHLNQVLQNISKVKGVYKAVRARGRAADIETTYRPLLRHHYGAAGECIAIRGVAHFQPSYICKTHPMRMLASDC